MLQYIVANNNFNTTNLYICLILIILSLYFYIKYNYTAQPRQWTKAQLHVLKRMADDGAILIIRLEENKFQIVYEDGHAINTWHPRFIEFFSFMKVKEILDINKILEREN